MKIWARVWQNGGGAERRDRRASGASGTISYVSLEQASAGQVDCRSDIWSLGIVIHEMLAGARPFHGDDRLAVLQAILMRDPGLTATSYPDVPAGIDRILRRALMKAPDQRYDSMSVLAAELSALVTEAVSGHALEVDDPVRMSTTERRRAAVLVTVVSDYASLVDQMTPIEAHARDAGYSKRSREAGLHAAQSGECLPNRCPTVVCGSRVQTTWSLRPTGMRSTQVRPS